MGVIIDAHPAFAHSFQQGALSFRRRAVDFIRKHDVRENGSLCEN